MISTTEGARKNRADSIMARDIIDSSMGNMLEVMKGTMVQVFEEVGMTAIPKILEGRGLKIEFLDDSETNSTNPRLYMLRFTLEIPIPDDETIQKYKDEFSKTSPIQIYDDNSESFLEHLEFTGEE